MMKKIFYIAGFFTAFAFTTQGQVTIGSLESPSKAALLDLKTQAPDATDNVTSTKGGLVLPRVRLVDINTLEPFIPPNETDAKVKSDHVGLTVYNLNPTSPFIEGLYLWNGTKWTLASSDAENGLRVDNNKIKLGGNLTADTTTIHLRNKVLIFDNEETPAYDASNDARYAGLRFKDLEPISVNSEVLVVDKESGRLGIRAVESMPAKLLFCQSAKEYWISGLTAAGTTNMDTQNAGNTYIIPWETTELADQDNATNNLLEFIQSGNAFQVPDSVDQVLLEMSGYIGYVANILPDLSSSNLNGGITILNAAIQIARYDKDKGTYGLYENWTSVRAVYTDAVTPYRQTLSIPPAVFLAKAKDRIRMVVIPEPSGLGVTHQRPRIVAPYGTSIARSIKIIAQ